MAEPEFDLSTTAGARGKLNYKLGKLKGSWFGGSKVRQPTGAEEQELTDLSNTVRNNARYEGGGITSGEFQMSDAKKAADKAALDAELSRRKQPKNPCYGSIGTANCKD